MNFRILNKSFLVLVDLIQSSFHYFCPPCVAEVLPSSVCVRGGVSMCSATDGVGELVGVDVSS